MSDVILSDGHGSVHVGNVDKVEAFPGDPVRVEGRHGHWRFLGLVRYDDAWYAIVVGPHTHSRNPKCPTERIFPVDVIRPAHRGVSRQDVAMSAELLDLSLRAKARKR